jgi:aspergillopepsin I
MSRWVFSTSLSSSQLGEHSAFDPSKSSTWEELQGASWDISYGDGSGASGTVGYDTVDVGGATATKQAVELATVVSSAFVSDENNDGLLGLAFGKINTVQPTQQKCFFENIADQLDEQLFTADLDVDASGTYEFGKLDTSKYQGELHTTPIDNSRGFWEFSSNSYSINGKEVQGSTGSPAIADTGTSLMMVDDDVAKAYYSQIYGASMNSEAGGYVYPCDADVPSFGVAIGDSGFMATINGSDIEYAKVGGNTCFGGIQGNGGQGLQIFGAVLLKQYFAVFNFGDLTFGLAQKN